MELYKLYFMFGEKGTIYISDFIPRVGDCCPIKYNNDPNRITIFKVTRVHRELVVYDDEYLTESVNVVIFIEPDTRKNEEEEEEYESYNL